MAGKRELAFQSSLLLTGAWIEGSIAERLLREEELVREFAGRAGQQSALVSFGLASTRARGWDLDTVAL